VERLFARYFDGKRARVGDVELVVEENLIAQAIGLPLDKEKWFKNNRVKDIPWKSILASKRSSYDIKGLLSRRSSRKEIFKSYGSDWMRSRFGFDCNSIGLVSRDKVVVPFWFFIKKKIEQYIFCFSIVSMDQNDLENHVILRRFYLIIKKLVQF
jgi:hypothetical protein